MNPLLVPLHRHISGRWGDAIALVAGAITPLSFAPLSWWPLAIVGPALLFWLWLFSSARRAAGRGALFGIGLFGVGISWVFVSIYYHGHVNLPLSIGLTLLLVLVMATFPALLGYGLMRWLPRRFESRYIRYKLLLVFPAAWVLVEWIRGWFMTGFPWLSLGYSQTESVLVGVAPILGVFGVTWVIAFSAALIIAVLIDRSQRVSYVFVLTIIWGGSWLLSEYDWAEPVGEPIKAVLLQGNIPQDIKWHPDVRRPTIDLYTELTRNNWDADLIVWPETALPAFYYEAEGFINDLEAEAKENKTDMLIGMLTFGSERRRYYNTMMSLGSSRGQYHKDHLVPFTEYLPLKNLLGGLVSFMRVPMSDFSAGGDAQKPLSVAGHKAAISICFEDAFGEEVIRALPEAGFLVNVSNDAWFDNTWAPEQHLQMARMRAIEAERPLLRATNTGMTAIVDVKGRVTAQAPQFEMTSISAVIQPRTGATPYVLFGNWAVVLLMMGLVLLAGWRMSLKRHNA